MKVNVLRSDRIYHKIAQAPHEEKVELFRQEMMAPFMEKWNIQHIPFKAADPNGFDVITLNNIMGISPEHITPAISSDLEAISADSFWEECEETVKKKLGHVYRARREASCLRLFIHHFTGEPQKPCANVERRVYW